jgi:polyphosphate kinase 2 (PPK2 family)
LEDPTKNWKFAAADLAERKFWHEYMAAYGEVFSKTSTKWAPWYVIPADYKWTARAMVADILTTTIRSLDLRYPEVTKEGRRALVAAKRELGRE